MRTTIVLAVALAAFGCTKSEQKASTEPAANASGEGPLKELSLDDVEKKLGGKDVYVYDANPREVFEKRHLPGATWVESDKITASILPQNKESTLIFYCANPH